MIPFKSKLSKYRNLTKRNEAFHKLTERQQRREIAFDSLKLLLNGTIEAQEGVYWGYGLRQETERLDTPAELQKHLNKLPKEAKCNVCARGALMVSQIRLGNKVRPGDYFRAEGCSRNVQGFNMRSFEKMEREFEYSDFNHPYRDGSNKKLANILCNVIQNGDFDETKRVDYVKKWKLDVLENYADIEEREAAQA